MSQGSTYKPFIYGFNAAEDLSAKQFRAVKFASTGTDDNKKVVAAGAGERAVGILQNDPADGRGAEVAVAPGGSKMKLGGTVALGQLLKSDANGDGVVIAAGDEEVVARALEAGVDNDVISVQVWLGKSHSAE